MRLPHLTRCTFLSLSGMASLLLAADPFLDVSTAVRDRLKENSLAVDASNELFTDPAEGVGKHLRVEYTVDGEEGRVTVSEGNTLHLTAKHGKTLLITKATYGDLPEAADKLASGIDPTVDVTKILTAAVNNGKLSLTVGNDTMGSDPAFGSGKQVRVRYTVAGAEKTVTAGEGEELNLPTAADGVGALVIVDARYGVLDG
jgi:Domain of unknown function (DUF3395)